MDLRCDLGEAYVPFWGQTQQLNERVGLDSLQGLSVLTLSSRHTVINITLLTARILCSIQSAGPPL